MSAEKVIYKLLTTDAELLLKVPKARIYAGEVPQGSAMPAVSYRHVSTVEHPAVSAGAETLVTSRIQIFGHCKTYAEQKALLKLIRVACNNRSGMIADVVVRNIRRDVVGPDLENAEATIYSQSVDFMVKFIEPNA